MRAGIPSGNATPSNLQQIIAQLTEGVIILEPDGTIAWADATGLALHGADALAELGTTVADYTSRFALARRGGEDLRPDDYPMHRLLAGEAIDKTLVDVVRRSDGRRWVHEIRTLILNGADERPNCYVVILDDETERFNAEERFERAFAANPAPAIIARLSDMRYVKVNHGFLELTGYHRTALIGRSMHEIDVLHAAEKRELALRRLHAGETIPQMEGSLPLPDGRGERAVLLGGQPLTIGDAACMLFTFADLHARQEAQRALRQSEERFAKAFHMAPCPMAMLALDELRILDVNDAFTAATGWRREEVLGRREDEIEIWQPGEPRDHLARGIRQAGHVHGVDIQLRSKSGGVRDYLLSAETVQIHQEHCILSVMLDITERKQTETELLAAVQSAMQDSSWLGQKIVEKLATINQGKGRAATPELSSLPARAREVLSLMAQGLPDEAIASQLGIARNTLRNHIAAIYAKLGVHKRSAVVVWARERGLVASPKPQPTRTKQKVTRPD